MIIGDQFKLTATLTPDNVTNATIKWRSNDASIATVDENGVVTAAAVGKATITATTVNGLEAACEITVAEIPASGIVIDKGALGITGDNLEMRVGDIKTIHITVEPATTTDKSVTFASSDPSIAGVDADGKVTAFALGETTITITAKSGVSTTINVTVVATPAALITLNKTEATLKATETVALEATVGPETTTDKTVTWTTSDASIATVDENGVVTAVTVGKATITATTVNGLKATSEITVVATPAASITLNKTEATLKATETVSLEATVAPDTTTDKSVIWSSSDSNIATVDENGVITAVAVGKATITATTANGLKAECEITVVESLAASISLNKSEATLKATETVSLEATIGPETTTDKTVTWTTSDDSIATVDENGIVTAVAVGNATITATTANGLKATCEITVAETPASGIVIDKDALGITGDNLEMRVGDTKTINVSVEPATTTDKSVTFSSSNAEVATVYTDGKVTALALGETTITITAKSGVSTTINVTVVATPAASITLNKAEATLKATETVALEATVGPETTTNKSVTWSTSDASIGTVDENGVVTAVAVGKATITATTANGLKATCEITVAETPASGIVIDKDALGITGNNLEMRVGDTKTINVTVEPATATDKTITFSSSNAEVATVDADGKVTALALGETTITITARSGVSASITVNVVATSAASITLNKIEATLKATETVALEATIDPETTTDKSVTWSTSDASIATVDEDGVVTAVAVGNATITATTANGLKASCKITVAETPASGIVIDKDALGIMGDNLEMRVGDSKTINVTVEPTTTTDKTVTFASSDPAVATVDADGKVTALSLGETTITITAKSGVSTSIIVNVVATPASSITLNKTEATLKATETVSLEATVSPETTTDKSVTWSTSDASIATVDEDGVVTAVAVGNATITATTANGLKASCKITVAETPASGIVIDKDALGIMGDNLEMRVGDSKTINVTVEPTTTTDKTVTFASSDPAVATVDADGKVTALSLGETTITITAKSGVSTSIIVNVVATPASSITLNKTEATLKATETVSLEATVSPETTTDKSVTWSTSDASIATVDEDGVVTAVAVGKAIITATTANGLTASCDITVLHRDVPAAEAAINGELFDILSGEKLKLKVNYIGGLESGWSFDWRINDCQQSEGNKAEYEFAKSTAGEYRVSVHVANNCDGELIYDNTFIITVNVWARPELPGGDDIDVNTPVSAIGSDNVVRVRQNDILILDVAEGQGGYDNGWTYDWNTDGTAIGEGLEIETVATMNAGDTKAIERHTYTVNVKNTSPDGAVWAENTLSIATDVYRRPATPSSLVRKGDGTTHTLICMLTVADNQLAPLGYSFVYGYEATDGSEHEIARTTKRYCRASEQVYNNPSNRFWVYAVWTYDDGCTVSSGKRYLDGSVDEEFNASVFDPSQTGTRGADFSNSANWINVSGKSVGISVDSDSDTFISVFTAGGIMIRSLTVEAGTSVREQIDLSTLSDGIYIVNVTSGNEAVSRKFIIK